MILPLEKQVVSVEYARRLKELNCAQDSLYHWFKYKHQDEFGIIQSAFCPIDKYEIYSAYTVAELGELLYKSFNEWVQGWNDCQYYFLAAPRGSGSMIEGVSTSRFIEADTEADARALFIIHLLENKLITLEVINDKI